MTNQNRKKAPLPVREPGAALRHFARIGAAGRRIHAPETDDTGLPTRYPVYGRDRLEARPW